MTLTYRISTLGCRMNHAESRDIESILLERGLVAATEQAPADLEVVHSCTVTSAAAAKSRHAVRRAARRRAPDQPPPMVIVTGCWVGSNEEEAGRLVGDATAAIGHDASADPPKHTEPLPDAGSTLIGRLERRVDRWLRERRPRGTVRTAAPASSGVEPSSSAADATSPRVHSLPVVLPQQPARHTRAEIRIQDGCDAWCTFCIIPQTRPVLRSKSVPETVREARALVELGHREIVLSGVFLGAYGHETALRRKQAQPGSRLADLVDAVAAVPGVDRLRLSSVEPGDVDESLLDAMVAHRDVVVPHLHVPLQSGSDAILRRMNRQYRVDEYLEMISMAERALTHDGLPPAFTTDVICGFPGETDDDFAQTVAIAERVRYLHLHVFPFSARAGTAAARWRGAFVDDATKKARVRTLIDMEEAPENGWSIEFRRRLVGRTARVLIEQLDADDPTRGRGRCDHYAMIDVESDSPLTRGALVDVEVMEVSGGMTSGRRVQADVRLPVL